MSNHRKLYPDVFEPNILISLYEKKCTNLQMIDKNVYLLREIKAKKKYLHDYWYSLGCCTKCWENTGIVPCAGEISTII